MNLVIVLGDAPGATSAGVPVVITVERELHEWLAVARPERQSVPALITIIPKLPIDSSSNLMNAGCIMSRASVSHDSVDVILHVPLNAMGVVRSEAGMTD